MATTADIMTAISEQLDDLINIPAQTLPIAFAGRAFALVPPCVDMFIANPTGLEAGLSGFYDLYGGIPITIRVRVPSADIEAGEDIVLGLMDDEDPLSIVAALDSDRTIGGVIDTLFWADGYPWTGLTDFQDPSGNGFYVGSTMTIVVVKSNPS